MSVAFVLLILAFIVVAIAVYVVKRKNDHFAKSIPEEARVENLRNRYQGLLENLKAAVDSSESELSLLNALQAVKYPEETLFVSLVRNGRSSEDGITIIDRTKSFKKQAVHSTRGTHNGGGYGRFDDNYFFILHHETKKYHDSRIVLWFESDTPLV